MSEHSLLSTATPVEMLAAFALLALAPVIVMTVTAFPRIVIVLGLLRASLGAPAVPPNAVIAALALMLAGVVMAPTIGEIRRTAVSPYMAHRLPLAAAAEKAQAPLVDFMLRQARPADVAAFGRMERTQRRHGRPPLEVVAPAFLVGELRAAFSMGLVLALPFAAIDVVVSAILMSLGMFMVAPNSIALPLKLLLFVIVDGWTLLAGALVASFR